MTAAAATKPDRRRLAHLLRAAHSPLDPDGAAELGAGVLAAPEGVRGRPHPPRARRTTRGAAGAYARRLPWRPVARGFRPVAAARPPGAAARGLGRAPPRR